MVKHVTSSELEELIAKGEPVFCDFWAVWCGPCRAFAPVFEELSDEYKDLVKFVKVNVDYAPQTAQSYQIKSIPTLILFKDGKQVEKWIGGRSKADLKAIIDAAIK